MKRFLSLLLASLLIVSSLALCVSADGAEEDTQLKLVSLGDSNATGFNTADWLTTFTENPVDYLSTSAPALLADKLGAEFISYAFEGNTAEYFKDQFGDTMPIRYYDPETGKWPWVEIDNTARKSDIAAADIITISIGGMDMFYDSMKEGWGDINSMFQIDPDDIIGSLKNLYNTLKNLPSNINDSTSQIASDVGDAFALARELNPTATILYANNFNPYENIEANILGLELKEIVRIIMTALNAKIVPEAFESTIIMTDVQTLFMIHADEGVIIKACDTLQQFINREYIEDPHPTKHGHKLIADAYYKMLVATGSLPVAYGYTNTDGTLLPDTIVSDADIDASVLPSKLVIKTTKGDFTVDVTEWTADKEVVAGAADTYTFTAVIDNMPKHIVNAPEIKVVMKAFCVPEAIKGDANADGVVNNKDVTAIASYIKSQGAYYIVEDNADMNGDGKITSKDIVWLLSYIRKLK